MKLSQADLRRAAERAQSLHSRLQSVRRQAEQVTERLVYTAEVSAAAFTSGVIQSKTDPNKTPFLGIPLELALGAGLNLAGYLGLAGPKMSIHLHGFGDGFLAAYLNTLGRGVGVKMAGGPLPPLTPNQGLFPGLGQPEEIEPAEESAEEAAPPEGGGTGRLETVSAKAVGTGAAGFTDTELAEAVLTAASVTTPDEEE